MQYAHTHTCIPPPPHTHRWRVHTLVAEGSDISSQFPHSSNILPAHGLWLGHSSLPNLLHHCHNQESNTGCWRIRNQFPAGRGKNEQNIQYSRELCSSSPLPLWIFSLKNFPCKLYQSFRWITHAWAGTHTSYNWPANVHGLILLALLGTHQCQLFVKLFLTKAQ